MTLRSALVAPLVCLVCCGGQADIHPASGDAGGPSFDAASVDASPGVTPDATVDASIDGATPAAPRPLAPLSTSRVTTRRPTLRWVLPPGVADATVDLCFDRACTRPIGSPARVTGSRYAPPSDLPVGVVFWRLHPSTLTSVTSPTWQFTVGARSAPVDSSWGTTLDVNGDGFADVAVGAPRSNTGAAYVYLGSATGLSRTPATTLRGVTGGFADFGWGYGAAVASAGDVNGDGFADLAVAADGEGAPQGVCIYLGGEDGLATTPSVTLPSAVSAGGLSMASAGDVNGDGYADLVVAGQGVGIAVVYYGSATGLAPLPGATIGGLEDAAAGQNLLSALVASAGDVNGDGFGDVLVGYISVGGPLGLDGGVYVYLGSAGGIVPSSATLLAQPVSTGGGGSSFDENAAGAGDVNGDGYADVVVGQCEAQDCASVYLGSAHGVVPARATTLTFPSAADMGSGASAGDVNGDGYGDLIVATRSNGTQAVLLYLGGAAGLAEPAASTLTQANSLNDNFGAAIGGAGDVNGDGYADVVVGVSMGTPGGTGPDPTGSAYLYAGSATGLATTPATTLVGVAGDNGGFGSSVFGASD